MSVPLPFLSDLVAVLGIFSSTLPTKTMKYFYFDQANQKQGPVTDQQLKELVAQGVIVPTTSLETETGHKGLARQIPGLFTDTPFTDTTGNKKHIEKMRQVLDEFKQTDFKSEIFPIDENNLNVLLKDPMFWVILALGVLPLVINTFGDYNAQYLGMLFFFAMFWGGLLRGVVLKSNEKITLPIVAFFFTGIVGMALFFSIFPQFPNYYFTLVDSKNHISQLIGFVFGVGVWEETCKILPVIIYLAWK